jgi:DNA invertase Pin-like site-specific DNA recombinase
MEQQINAAIYLRMSLDRNNDGLGVARQDDDCSKVAELRRWNVAHRLTDNDTSAAGKAKRPSFEELLQLIASDKIQVIIAWNLDRLTRNRRDTVRLIELCQEHGVTIALARGSDLDMSTAMGRMMAGQLAEWARYEIEVKSERHQAANRQKAAMGKPHASRRPFGYEMGYAAIRQDEAAVYRQMVKRVCAGHSCKDAAYWLNEQGHSTTQGKLFYPITVRNILASPRYIAVRDYKGAQYAGTWEPLISRDEWDSLQLRLKMRTAMYSQPALHARKYLLTGLLVCGRCGNRLTGTARHDRPTSPVRRIYTCKLSGDTRRRQGCSLRRNADALDAFIRDAVIFRLDTPVLSSMLEADGDADHELRKLVESRADQDQRTKQLVKDTPPAC